jgi:hypothetical protein
MYRLASNQPVATSTYVITTIDLHMQIVHQVNFEPYTNTAQTSINTTHLYSQFHPTMLPRCK